MMQSTLQLPRKILSRLSNRGKRGRAVAESTATRQENVAQGNVGIDWSQERSYWHERIRDWYLSRYGLELDPIQNDDEIVPGVDLISQIQTANKANPDIFYASGCRGVLGYLQELSDHGFDPLTFKHVLEFGVGFGRLLRHYAPFPARLSGCDVTQPVVDYLNSVLGHRLSATHNSFAPPLPYPGEEFDFLYANSVFTHISPQLTPAWIAELARIVRPGGCVIATVLDSNVYLNHLSPSEIDQIEQGKGTYGWGLGGRAIMENYYYSSQKLRELWGRHFEVLELRGYFQEQSHLILRKS